PLEHAVDGGLDSGLEIARKGGEELLFDRLCLRPVLESNEPGVRVDQFLARTVEKRDRLRLDLLDGETGRRRGFRDGEFLRLKAGACTGGERRHDDEHGNRV